MPSSVKISSQAWQSVDTIASYNALNASLRTAQRFYRSFQKACHTFARFPQLGASWQSADPKLQQLRFWSLSKPFQRYLVFYSIQNGQVEVIEVLHGSRDLEDHLE